MILTSLHIRNFKNHGITRIELAPKINCFFGLNAAGKTNILDAIHYLCWTKSYFNSSDLPALRFETDFFSIEGLFEMEGSSSEVIKIHFTPGQGKKLFRNDKEYERFSDHIGRFPAIFIAPGDTDLIGEAAEMRRKFFDAGISQSDRNYLQALIRYNKVLMQRNKTLKWMQENRKNSAELLAAYNIELDKSATLIAGRRHDYIQALIPLFNEMYELLSGNAENAGIRYDSEVLVSSMPVLLDSAFSDDLRAGFTTRGIHKDDFYFTIDNHPVRRMASQGQQKTYMIALKLAQYVMNSHESNNPPLLLFDDIFDKLDPRRVKFLIDRLQQPPFGQIFVTDTHKIRLDEVLQNIHPHKIFQVDGGQVKEI